jgi:hypothetical protein
VILVDEAFEVMAKAIDTYDDLLGGRPDFPVRLDIYPDGTRFIAASGLPAEAVRTTGVIALSKWNRLLVTSPRALPRGYAWKDTVAHEYIHLVVAYRTNDRTPVWLQEGLAKYFEGAWRGEDGGCSPCSSSRSSRGRARRRVRAVREVQALDGVPGLAGGRGARVRAGLHDGALPRRDAGKERAAQGARSRARRGGRRNGLRGRRGCARLRHAARVVEGVAAHDAARGGEDREPAGRARRSATSSRATRRSADRED